VIDAKTEDLLRSEQAGDGPADHPGEAPAVRAHLLEMTGDLAGARACYLEAAGLTANLPLQRYLYGRAALE
jgi:hypothetical protein